MYKEIKEKYSKIIDKGQFIKETAGFLGITENWLTSGLTLEKLSKTHLPKLDKAIDLRLEKDIEIKQINVEFVEVLKTL